MANEIEVLKEYVATANSGKYNSWEEINSKFPELKDYDTEILKEYVATANSGKYKSWEEIDAKFPEFEPLKKNFGSKPIQPNLGSGGTVGASEVQSTESKGGLFSPLAFSEKLDEKTLQVKQTPAPKGKYTLEKDGQIANVTREDIFKNIDNEEFLSGIQSGEVNIDIQDDAELFNLLNEKLSFYKAQPIEPKVATQEDIDFWESAGNSIKNVFTTLKGFFPRADVLAADVYENILGKEIAQGFYKWTGADIDKTRNNAYAKLAELEKQMLPTRGLVESAQKKDLAGIAAGTVDAVSAIFSTALPSLATGGAGLVTEMIGGTVVDYNNIKAEEQGVSVEELYQKGDAELATPMIIGSAAVGLESIGLKGIGRYINQNIRRVGIKRIADLFLTFKKEGLTEWTQTGLEEANKVLAKGGSVDDASRAAADVMLSEKGLESYLKGGVGATSTAIAGRFIKGKYNAITKKNKEQTDKLQKEAEVAKQIANNPTVSKEAKQAVSKEVQETEAAINEIQKQEINTYNSIEDKTEIDNLINEKNRLETIIRDESITEEQKQVFSDKLNQVNTQIDNIFNEKLKEAEKLASEQFRELEKEKIADLAQRISKGEKIESAEDLQLQQNFPKELEAELLKIKENEPTTTVGEPIQEEVKAPINERKGESVTVNIGGKAISGIVEVDEGGKAQIVSGNQIFELPNDIEYVEYVSPVRIADGGSGIEYNGDVYSEARFDVNQEGQERVALIKEDGTLITITNPVVVEELKYQSALAIAQELSEQEANNLINEYESERATAETTQEGVSEANREQAEQTEQEVRLQEAIAEIDLLEQIALEQIEQAGEGTKLVQFTPKGSKTPKVYSVTKNTDGTYSATLNGKKVVNKDVLKALEERHKNTTKKQTDALIPQLQEQLNQLKQEVENKLFGVTPKTETDAVQVKTAGEVPVQPEARISEEVEERTPETEPKEVAEEEKIKIQEDEKNEQEPIIEAIERKAESDNEVELNEAVNEADQLIQEGSGESANIRSKPIAELKTDEKNFQGRTAKYAKRSVLDILGNFNMAALDPIRFWKNEKGEDIVLAGHSRKKAFEIIDKLSKGEALTEEEQSLVNQAETLYGKNAEQIVADAKKQGFKEGFVPKAEEFKGTLAQAKDFALKSNAKGTAQTPFENSKVIAQMRKDGASNKEIENALNELAQRGDKEYTDNLSRLDPKGKAAATLEQADVNPDKVGEENLKKIREAANTTGKMRKMFPELTRLHEDEIFNAILNGKVKASEVADRVNRVVNSLTDPFNPSNKLNIEQISNVSPQEAEFNNKTNELKTEIRDLQVSIKKNKDTGLTPIEQGLLEQAIAKNNGNIEAGRKEFEGDFVQGLVKKKTDEAKALIDRRQKQLQDHLSSKKDLRGQGASLFDMPQPEQSPEEIAKKSLIDKIQDLKIKGGDKTGTLMLAPKLWNGFLDVVIAGLKAGEVIGNAVKKGIDWLNSQGVTDVEPYLNELEIKAKEPSVKQAVKKLIPRKPTEQKRIDKAYALGVADTKADFKAKLDELKSDFKEFLSYTEGEAKKAIQAAKDKGAMLLDQERYMKKQITSLVTSALDKDFISQRTFNTIMNRLGKAKTPNQYQKLFDYINKAADQADYAERMAEVSKLQKQAKDRNHTSMQKVVNDFVNINPELIPDNLLPQYIQALDELSGRVPKYTAMTDIYYQVMAAKPTPKPFENVTTYQKAKELYDKINLNKVGSIEEYRALFQDINGLKRRINQLIESELRATNPDQTVIDGFEDILEQIGKDQEAVENKYASEIATLKTDMINELRKSMNSSGITNLSKPEKELLARFYDLDNNDLRSLSPEELYNLQSIMDNVREDGYLDVFRLNPLVIKAENSSQINSVANQINKSKNFKKAFNDRFEALRKLGATYGSFWESALGLGSVEFGAFTKNIVAPMERAIGKYRRQVNEGYAAYRDLKKKHGIAEPSLLDRLRNNDKALQMTKLGMISAYLREYAMQFDPEYTGKKDANGNTLGTRDWFEIIIKTPQESGKLSKEELDKIEKVWNKLPKVNGKVDVKAVYDSYINGTTEFLDKNEIAFLKDVNKWKEENITPLQKYANELRGKGFNEVLFHTKRIRKGGDTIIASPVEKSEKGNLRIAAGSGKEVTNNNVGAIETDFEKLFAETVEESARDFHITPMLQQQSDLLKKTEQQVEGDNKEYVEVARENLKQAIEYEFEKTQSGFLERIARNFMKAKASQVLIAPLRTVNELFSSAISYPLRSKELGSVVELFKKRDAVRKLMEITDSPFLSKADLSKHFDVKDGSIRGEDMFSRGIQFFAAMPERVGLEPVWMASFSSQFLKETGVEFDRKEFISNPSYATKYKKAIQNSAAVADTNYSQIAGSTTQAGSRRDIKILPSKIEKAFGVNVKANTISGQMLSFFTNYPFREVEQGMKSARALVEVAKNKEYDYKDGLVATLPLLGSFLGALYYQYSQALVYNLKEIFFADDEEEKEKAKEELNKLTSAEGILNESIAAVSSVGSTRYSGASKALIQLTGTVIYNFTDDEELKKKAKSLTRDITFKNPFEIKRKKDGDVVTYGMRDKITAEIAMYLPPLATAGDNVYKVLESLGGYPYLYNKAINGEVLSEPEKEALVLAQLFVNASNAVLMFSGGAIPFSNEINKFAKKELKEEKKKSGTTSGEITEGEITEENIEEAEIKEIQ